MGSKSIYAGCGKVVGAMHCGEDICGHIYYCLECEGKFEDDYEKRSHDTA